MQPAEGLATGQQPRSILSSKGAQFEPRVANAEGRTNSWNESARDAAQIAQDSWVRVSANMSLGAYDTFTALGDIPEPEWPDLSFEEILKIAFKGKYIESTDHVVIRDLLGGEL